MRNRQKKTDMARLLLCEYFEGFDCIGKKLLLGVLVLSTELIKFFYLFGSVVLFLLTLYLVNLFLKNFSDG